MAGSATATDDFTVTGLGGTNNDELTIAMGDTEASFTITAVDDTATEGDETIQLGFGTITGGGNAGSRTTATVTINASGGGGGGTTTPATTAPGVPTIDAATPGEGSLVVTWTAPADNGGETITAYDLRYIRSDAADKADGKWNLETEVWTGSGSLEDTVTGLTHDTEYDVQVRAVNSVGNGAWSATVTGTTMPAPDPCVTALGTLTGTVTETGSWADDCDSVNRSGSYAHFYTFTLEAETEVTIDLTSEEDPFLYLLQGEGRDGTVGGGERRHRDWCQHQLAHCGNPGGRDLHHRGPHPRRGDYRGFCPGSVCVEDWHQGKHSGPASPLPAQSCFAFRGKCLDSGFRRNDGQGNRSMAPTL